MMNNDYFFASEENDIAFAMEQIDNNLLKVVFVIQDNKLIGAVSDGDIRRFLMNGGDIKESLTKVINYSPVYIYENQLCDAKRIIEEKQITALPIINYNKEILDIVTFDRTIKVQNKKIDIPVVVMAGGKGTRLYPYTKILPKPLIPVGEIPITELIINHFVRYGCTSIFMIVNYKKNMIKSYFDNITKNYDLQFVDESIPLGTGGGLSLMKPYQFDDIFFTNCDTIIDANYEIIYDFHKKEKNFITMVCAKKQNTIPYGVVILDTNNNYLRMKEKPSFETIINTGMYIVPRKVIEEMNDNESVSFPEIIEHYREQGEKIGVYVIDEDAFMDMGQLQELEKMRRRLESRE